MNEPLAYRIRPQSIDDIVGQEHITSKNSYIRKVIENKKLYSMIFFGPPGSGKTTTALIIAKSLNKPFRLLNAVTDKKKDMEEVVEEAYAYGNMVLILDEVHRMNKDKQDFLLPHIESGLITLIGATTANPYHSINPAIRSRCHLIEFKSLNSEDIYNALIKVLNKELIFDKKFTYDEKAIEILSKLSGGDIRYALNALEVCCLTAIDDAHISIDIVKQNQTVPQYLVDANEDGHYDAVSALQKSIRGSDVDGALYYLARLIAANDLESIERRLSITAWEDIGLANLNAVTRCMEAIELSKKVGFPEAAIPLGVSVVELALSPKSKSGYLAIEKAMQAVNEEPLQVPSYLKYTPVGLKEDEKYPYDRPDLWNKIQYLPEMIKDASFYKPSDTSSYERALAENYIKLKQIKRSNNISFLRKNNK